MERSAEGGSPSREIINPEDPTILVVDRRVAQPDGKERESFASFLKHYGIYGGELNMVHSGSDAIVRSASKPYDILMIMSWKIGDMTAVELAEKIHEVSPATLPVLVTGGNLLGTPGVPTREELARLGINHVFKLQTFINASRKREVLLGFYNEIKAASIVRKQNPLASS